MCSNSAQFLPVVIGKVLLLVFLPKRPRLHRIRDLLPKSVDSFAHAPLRPFRGGDVAVLRGLFQGPGQPGQVGRRFGGRRSRSFHLIESLLETYHSPSSSQIRRWDIISTDSKTFRSFVFTLGYARLSALNSLASVSMNAGFGVLVGRDLFRLRCNSDWSTDPKVSFLTCHLPESPHTIAGASRAATAFPSRCRPCCRPFGDVAFPSRSPGLTWR